MSTAPVILVVDDEASVLTSLKEFLELNGFEALGAEHAEAALALAQSRPLDMVISDYKLPGMNGDVLLRRVKELQPGAVRVMISGYADMDVVLAAFNEGIIQRFFPKPFNMTELLISVRNLLQTHGPSRGTAPPQAPTVLLVDDSKYFRTLLTRLLQPRYLVHAVEDGIQAINQAKVTPPDLVVSGLTLFGVNGHNLVKFLRLGLHLTCPIVIWDYAIEPEARTTLGREVSLFFNKDERLVDEVVAGIEELLG